MRVPSGDHTGARSSAASLVKRRLVLRSRSTSQMSPAFTAATRVPSGDRLNSV